METLVVEDVVKSLGFLPLGTRLKRLGDRMQAGSQRVMDEMQVPLQASQYPFLAALDRLGPLTLGDLADAVGVTQPGATRAVSELARRGMLRTTLARDDQRQKIISLTAKGQQQIDFAKAEVWPRIEAAVTELCGHLSGPLLQQLGAIEKGLAEIPLDRRAIGRKRPR